MVRSEYISKRYSRKGKVRWLKKKKSERKEKWGGGGENVVWETALYCVSF